MMGTPKLNPSPCQYTSHAPEPSANRGPTLGVVALGDPLTSYSRGFLAGRLTVYAYIERSLVQTVDRNNVAARLANSSFLVYETYDRTQHQMWRHVWPHLLETSEYFFLKHNTFVDDCIANMKINRNIAANDAHKSVLLNDTYYSLC